MTAQVGSAVVSEITSRTITKVLQIFNIQPAVHEKLDKLDMLCIHIHGVVEASKKDKISCKYLLRWQEKLQEAATAGDKIRYSAFGKATKIAAPSMFSCFHGAANMLFSCSEDVHRLNSTLERLERLSADTEQFFRLIDLEKAMIEEHAADKGEKPVVTCRSSSLQKGDHQCTKRKRTLDSTDMVKSVKKEAPKRS